MSGAVPVFTLDVFNCRCGQDHLGLPLGRLLNPREVVDPRDRRRMILAYYLGHCPVSGYAIYAERPKEGGEPMDDKKNEPTERETDTIESERKTTEVDDVVKEEKPTTDDDTKDSA